MNSEGEQATANDGGEGGHGQVGSRRKASNVSWASLIPKSRAAGGESQKRGGKWLEWQMGVYLCVCICVLTCIYTLRDNVSTSLHLYIDISMYVHICACLCVYLCVCICVCLYMYVHVTHGWKFVRECQRTRTHTYTHEHTHTATPELTIETYDLLVLKLVLECLKIGQSVSDVVDPLLVSRTSPLAYLCLQALYSVPTSHTVILLRLVIYDGREYCRASCISLSYPWPNLLH